MLIAIIGTGKMGRAVEACASGRGHEVVARLGRREMAEPTAEKLAGAEVAIEFTRPDAALGNLEGLIDLGVPVVTGTTGEWLESLGRITRRVDSRGGALLHGANFSIGLQLFLRAAEALAEAARGIDTFDSALTETHHTAKLDAPSGTALEIARRVREVDPDRELPITSVRVGSVPGTHRLLYDGLSETIDLAHVVRDRAVFAEGAVRAAEWLVGKRGVFTFTEMLFGGES